MYSRLNRWLLFSGNRDALAAVILLFMPGIVLLPSVTRFSI
jgi:hypothetical protein